MTRTFSVVGMLALAFASLAPTSVLAAATCDFTRDLTPGIEGEDVRCLQKYLNASGYTVAETGIGSAGNEPTQLKRLTQAAIVKWQEANSITPAT